MKNYVVDSIRNPEEVNLLRKSFAQFFLFGVFAEPDLRWKRVNEKYNNDRRAFDEDDKRDSNEGIEHGQRVTDSFRMSDIILLNNENIIEGNKNEELFLAKLKHDVDLIEGKEIFAPTYVETNMVIAYAESMRSSCLKRKVGAVIVDLSGAVVSSGYNEVPAANNTCKIAQVGIKHIVYFEPYPMDETKKILADKGVEQEPFEGVTYNGYFRLMEVVF